MNKNTLYIEPDWPAPNNVHAVTTVRTGGVSQGAYASLNMATHVGDDLGLVKQNRALVSAALQLPCEPLWLSQTHSNIVVEAGLSLQNGLQLDLQMPEADASYTRQPGIVCTVMTADCLPLLLCSRDGKQIAAIHGGWRGLLHGIISNTIQVLKTTDVLVWFGPAIGPKQFEVGAEVLAAFTEKSSAYADAFQQKSANKWLADIYKIARIELASLAITDIYGGEFCTVTDATRFFSYRRDTVTGRMVSLIWRD
jgi:polyphenol oxidase